MKKTKKTAALALALALGASALAPNAVNAADDELSLISEETLKNADETNESNTENTTDTIDSIDPSLADNVTPEDKEGGELTEIPVEDDNPGNEDSDDGKTENEELGTDDENEKPETDDENKEPGTDDENTGEGTETENDSSADPETESTVKTDKLTALVARAEAIAKKEGLPKQIKKEAESFIESANALKAKGEEAIKDEEVAQLEERVASIENDAKSAEGVNRVTDDKNSKDDLKWSELPEEIKSGLAKWDELTDEEKDNLLKRADELGATWVRNEYVERTQEPAKNIKELEESDAGEKTPVQQTKGSTSKGTRQVQGSTQKGKYVKAQTGGGFGILTATIASLLAGGVASKTSKKEER